MAVVDIILLIIILGVIILIHEGGHFFVAKLANVLCHEYSIGMGPAVFKKKKKNWETRLAIRAIPLGGYVAMSGEDEADSYVKKDGRVGLILDKNKYVQTIVLTDNKKSDVKGKVYAYNTYNDDKRLYITLDVDGKLQRYYLKQNFDYAFKKGDNAQNAPKSRSFEAKSKFARFAILFAGPMMNFVLALFLLIIFFLFTGKVSINNTVGTIDPHIKSVLKEEGITKGYKLVKIDDLTITNELGIQEAQKYVMNNYKNEYDLVFVKDDVTKTIKIHPRIVVAKLGLSNEGYEKETKVIVGKFYKGVKKPIKKGYQITKVNNTIVNNWKELIDYSKTLDSGSVTLTYLDSENKEKTYSFSLISNKVLSEQNAPSYLVSIGIHSKNKFDVLYSFEAGFKSMWKITRRTVDTLKALFSPKSGVGITDLSGPVGMFSLVKQSRQSGFLNILFLTAFLSINIGFINLLPIPALDGGRMMFLTVEAISGRKVSKKVEGKANLVMFILLLALMIFIIGIDIVKLI